MVAGCLVQRYGAELPADLPEVDLFIGVNDFPALPELLGRGRATGAARLFHQAAPYAYRGLEARYPATPPHLAYLKIAEGCSHGCTFCLIPQIRGPLRSRPLNTLVQEAENLAAAGVKELILVAQDTTAYGRDQPGHPGMPALLRELAPLTGSGGSASSTATRPASPRNSWPPWPPTPGFSPTWISRSSTAMTRCCGAWDGAIAARISWTRFAASGTLPGATLRTTVMAGFPGETEAHFQALLDLIPEVGFDHLGVFLYSPRSRHSGRILGRPKVPRREARRRARLLKAIQAKIVKARLKSLVGTVQPKSWWKG